MPMHYTDMNMYRLSSLVTIEFGDGNGKLLGSTAFHDTICTHIFLDL